MELEGVFSAVGLVDVELDCSGCDPSESGVTSF